MGGERGQTGEEVGRLGEKNEEKGQGSRRANERRGGAEDSIKTVGGRGHVELPC